jgi:multidrug efflux system membrane fusion protein
MKKLILAGAAFAGFAINSAHSAEFLVESSQIEDRKAVIATVEPAKMLLARARIGGTVVSLKAKEGMMAQAGEDLAVIVDQKLALQIKGLDQRIQSQEALRLKAEADFNRVSELFKNGSASQAMLDQMKASLDVATRQLSALNADRDVIIQQTAEGTVRAPATGRVLTVPVSEGTVVMPGETISTLAEDDYILRIELPERHARFMHEGDNVQIAGRGNADDTDDTGSSVKKGTIRTVYPEIKGGRVIADVAVDKLGDYFVGERTRVYVSTGVRKTLLVPRVSVFERAGLDYVRLTDNREIIVKLGEVRGDKVEILSGLKAGDRVVFQ